MLHPRRRRTAFRHPVPCPAPGPTLPGPEAPAPVAPPNNNLFQEFMRTFMEKAQALVAPATEARDNTNRPLKPRNPDLYYGHLYMECYYFCQQCNDHFEVAGSLGHKRVLFAAGFLKDCILN